MMTKVMPINYDLDIEDAARKEDCYVVGIEEMSVTYTQPADTNSDSEKIQCLTLTTRMCESVGLEEADKKEGFYFDITISQGEH